MLQDAFIVSTVKVSLLVCHFIYLQTAYSHAIGGFRSILLHVGKHLEVNFTQITVLCLVEASKFH